ncbi:MAG: hypothetical protein WDN10_03115 [bacterium]
MAQNFAFEWQGKEYEYDEKTADWYWALGILATAAVLACILLGDFLLAVLIIAAAIAIALQSAKRSVIHRFRLDAEGLSINGDLYTFHNMQSFSILEYIDETLPPSLSIKTSSLLTPHLIIPLVGVDPVSVYEYLNIHVEHVYHPETLMERVVEFLRL